MANQECNVRKVVQGSTGLAQMLLARSHLSVLVIHFFLSKYGQPSRIQALQISKTNRLNIFHGTTKSNLNRNC